MAAAEAKQSINGAATTPAPPIPTPPLPGANQLNPSVTPPNRSSSPRPGQRPKKAKRAAPPASASNPASGDAPPPAKAASDGPLDGTVPPINVLIVEDNVINLKLLEQFMRKLRVRWKTAMNGQEAVNQWRTGGFHLVLMDIQLPVMNGLEATKEIRRLEALNGIGVFSGSPIDVMQAGKAAADGDNLEKELFKSPVIIVALTASSLQSDRHEALAAGCNDFLTKVGRFSCLVSCTGWMLTCVS
jgi:osomolarity two-component system response regulator SSK1